MSGLLATTRDVYVLTKKKHDLLFNLYVMRPLAAVVVAAIDKTGLALSPNQVTLLGLFTFVISAAILVAVPTFAGALAAMAVLEASYCLDCVDGMLARYKKIASKEGHLFDFFTDEIKALLLLACLSIRLYRTGGFAPAPRLDLPFWTPGHHGFLLAGISGVFVLASATSLTNFVRRPEVSGRESTVEAHYETVAVEEARSLPARAAQLVMNLLRFANHYPSHLWLFALASRLDAFFWMYIALNTLYLAKGWLGLIVRFGRPQR